MADTAKKNATAVEFVQVRILNDDVSCVTPTYMGMAKETPPIEILHRSGWHVRVSDGFAPTTLAAVLMVL